MAPLTIAGEAFFPAGAVLTDRSQLVFGTYLPSVADDTVGVPAGNPMTVVGPNGSLPTSTGLVAPSSPGFWRLQTTNTIVQDVDFDGSIKAEATGCGVRRCHGRGRPAQANAPQGAEYLPIIDAASSLTGSGGFFVEDSTLWADDPGWQLYGIKGKSPIRVDRTRIGNVTDAIQTYQGNATVRGCLIESLYRTTDPNQGDGWTHNDGIQQQGSGGTLTVIGNHFDLVVEPWSSRSLLCMLLTSDTGTPATAVEIRNNWFEGGSIPLNFAAAPSSSLVVVDNVIRAGQQSYTGGQTYHITAHSSVQAMWTQSGNTDWATGGPIRITG